MAVPLCAAGDILATKDGMLASSKLNAAKNNGYAFQWFAMSVALLIIYLVVNTKRMVK